MHNSLIDTTFCVRTFGCQMNKHDSERVCGMLEALGSEQVGEIEDADIVVFMTCCVREAADVRLLGQVASLKNIPLRAGSHVSKRVIAVGGCIGQRDGEKLTKELPHLDVVFGTHNLASLPRLVQEALEEGGHHVEVLDESLDFPTTGLPGCPSPSGATTSARTASFRTCADARNRGRSRTLRTKRAGMYCPVSKKSPCLART